MIDLPQILQMEEFSSLSEFIENAINHQSIGTWVPALCIFCEIVIEMTDPVDWMEPFFSNLLKRYKLTSPPQAIERLSFLLNHFCEDNEPDSATLIKVGMIPVLIPLIEQADIGATIIVLNAMFYGKNTSCSVQSDHLIIQNMLSYKFSTDYVDFGKPKST